MTITLTNFNKYSKYIFTFLSIFLLIFSVWEKDIYKIIVSLGLFLFWLPNLLQKMAIKMKESAKFYFNNILFFGMIGEVLTSHLFWYDKITHMFSGFCIFFFLFIIITLKKVKNNKKIILARNISKSLLYMFLILIAWEILEAILDFSVGTNLLQTGISDIIVDLMADLFGGILAAILCIYHLKHNKYEFMSEAFNEFEYMDKVKHEFQKST